MFCQHGYPPCENAVRVQSKKAAEVPREPEPRAAATSHVAANVREPGAVTANGIRCDAAGTFRGGLDCSSRCRAAARHQKSREVPFRFFPPDRPERHSGAAQVSP